MLPVTALCVGLASCGSLTQSSDAWAPVVGTDMFADFYPGFVPGSQFYYSYSTASRPGEVLVSPSFPSDDFGGTSWAPTDKPMGRYVFAIDLDSRTIDHVLWRDFLSLELEESRPLRRMACDFKSVHPIGTIDEWREVCPFGDEATGLLAVLSFDDSITKRREIGFPSIIPFSGSRKVFDTSEYHSGSAYIEVFALHEPGVPIFRMKKKYENWQYLPQFYELGGWVIGSRRPVLVVVDPGNRARPGQIVVVRLPSTEGRSPD